MKKTFVLISLWGILTCCAGLSQAVEKAGDMTGSDSSVKENRAVAKVNGVEISSVQLSKTEDNIRALDFEAGKDINNEEIRKEALDRIIVQELIYQRARQLGLKADEKKIERYLEQIKSSAGGEEAYREFLRKAGLSEKDLRSEAERSILIGDLYEREVASGIVVSEQEMRAEYEKEKDKFTIPEKIVLTDVIFFLDPEESSSVKKANEVLKVLRDEKKDPSDLESDGSFVVREITNPKGIDLPLLEAAAKLKEGELSGVIRSDGNLHIIKLRLYSREKQMSFDDVKQIIEKKLKSQAAKKRFQEWKAELKKNADIEIFGDKP